VMVCNLPGLEVRREMLSKIHGLLWT
jgi:hypothetical protein